MPPISSLYCVYPMKLNVDTQDEQSAVSCESGMRSCSRNNSGDESPDAVQLRLKRQQRDAERHRAYYKNETEEQRKRRRERDALRHKAVYQEKVKQKKLASCGNSQQALGEGATNGTSSPLQDTAISAMASADAKPRRNSITRVRTPKGRGSLKSSSSDLADSSSGKPVTNNTSTEGIRSNRSSISQCTDFSLSNSANSTYNMYEAFQALHTHYPADCSADPPAFPFDSTVELPFDAPDGTIDMEGNYIDELFENYEYRASAESELLEPFSTDFRSAPAPAPLPPPLNISSPIAEPPRKKSFVFNFSSSTARPDASADTVAGAASGPVREPSSLARLFGTANAAFSSPPVSAPSHASALVSSVPAAGVGSCAPSAAVSAVHVPVPAVPLSVLELELAEAESMPVEPSVPDSTGVTCGTGVPTEPEQVDLSSSTSLSSSATSATSAVAGQSADSVAVVAGVNTAPFFPPSSSS